MNTEEYLHLLKELNELKASNDTVNKLNRLMELQAKIEELFKNVNDNKLSLQLIQ